MNNLTTYKKIIVIACIVSIALGILLHFAYDFTNQNRIVGLVAPVNESVWEHLKLILIPFTIFSIAFYFYTNQKFSNMLLLTFLGNIVGMFVHRPESGDDRSVFSARGHGQSGHG